MEGENSRIHLGVTYFPESVPEEKWLDDIRLMKAAGLTVVRIAEFAWPILEPKEGEFEVDWLDRIINLLAEEGIKILLCTPGGYPPYWLINRYPDILLIDDQGQRARYGQQEMFCINSEDLHRAVQSIVRRLASHFTSNSSIIGWHLETGFGRVCYCENCEILFRSYLKSIYGSIDELNRHLEMASWSQKFSEWEQVSSPIGACNNPRITDEYNRFVRQSRWRYQKSQMDALCSHLKPDKLLICDLQDCYAAKEEFSSEINPDQIVVCQSDREFESDPLLYSATLDLTRGLKQKNFWVVEQRYAINRKDIEIKNQNKGEMRTRAWQAIAHSADALILHQWRPTLGEQDRFPGPIFDPRGQKRLIYDEVQLLSREFSALSTLVYGSLPKSQVAILYDFDDSRIDNKQFNAIAQFQILLRYHRPCSSRNVGVDLLPVKQATNVGQLSKYRLVIAPTLSSISDAENSVLLDYLSRGGHLVIATWRSVDTSSVIQVDSLAELLNAAGVEINDCFPLNETIPVKGNWFEGEARFWAERLTIKNPITTVIAKYETSNGWLDRQPAISVSLYKSGLIYYIGTCLDEAPQQQLLDKLLHTASVRPIITHPGIEVQTRINQADGQNIYIIINHELKEQTLWLPWPGYDHIRGLKTQSEITLEPLGVAVVTPIQ